MFRKLAFGLAGAAFAVLIAGQATAGDGGFVGVGAQFTWDNYKKPILVEGVTYDGADIDPGLSSLDYGSPNFGGAFHWGVTNQLVLTLTLDFGFFSHTVYPYPESGGANIQSVTANFWQIGAAIGAKFYFKEPEAGKVGLYLSGAVGAYFAGFGNKGGTSKYRNAMKSAWFDEDDCDTYPQTCDGDEKLDGGDLQDDWEDYVDDGDGEDEWDAASDADKAVDKKMEMIAALASPFVFQVAVGAEFFATDTFSIGADILGLRFAFANADVGQVDGTSAAGGTGSFTGEQKYINLYVYSAITMNFNLTGGGGSAKKEEEEAPVDDGWGTPAGGGQQPPANDGWGGGGWGGSGGWSTGPAAPSTPAPAPAPAPAAPAPAPEPAPAPAPAPPGGDVPPPPPPPPPPGY